MSKLKISAIIPTFDSAQHLPGAIQSLLQQTLSPKEYEIIVVDNASTDNTKDVVRAFLHHENVKYLYEPELGASQARNTGAYAALADYIAFLDSDEIASEDWLRLIVETFEQVRPQPASVGGRIRLKWQTPKPDWFPERYFSALGRMDYGNEPKFLGEPVSLFAGNMAFVKKVFLELGGFNVSFGKKNGTGLYAEEPELLARLRRKGHLVFYQPSAYIEHLVPVERATKKCLYERKYVNGKSEALFLCEQATTGRIFFLFKNILLRPIHIALLCLNYAFHRIVMQSDKALTDMVLVRRDCGYIVQCSRMFLRRSNPVSRSR
jgi:glycosyltransferase involved in cell wall biosynthesis